MIPEVLVPMNTPMVAAPPAARVFRPHPRSRLDAAQVRQSIVAAVEAFAAARAVSAASTPGYLSDMGVESYGLEVRTCVRPLRCLTSDRERRRHSVPDAAGRRERLEQQRVHVGFATISTFAKGVPPLIGVISLSNPLADNSASHSFAVRQ